MLKNLSFSALILLMFAMTSILSAQDKPIIYLSNHTFSSENSIIGTVSLKGSDARIKLKGDNAKRFTLKANKLSIRKKHIKSDTKWYDLTIEAQTGSGKVEETFRLVKDDFHRNRVIAHRGAWKNTGASENSISALQHAVRLGCQGSEFDVHMTLDSVLIVNHDPSFKGKVIHSTTFAELKQLQLSNGENMPGLEEYLKEGIKQNSTKLVLELKPTINKERAIQSARKVYELVRSMKAEAWIDYISFDYNICLELKRLDPYARVAYLNGDKAPDLLAADKLWGLDYNQSVFQKNPEWIEQAKAKGLTINAWTVNDPKLLQWFLDQKIDFITTNEPEMLLKMVGN
ncbi:MAG: glycerophosphodiester phosphodiesterase family protein [Daejeonella sp.]|uniref:glycerophosphodiester phosphodiesterase n=1 Tax=Daejeonella sp. TaxID=2805397 RepID=UPI002735701E|nr:glycerophosphodiester phosphodiesterase family protein [Daejeonella sp.]MDP3469633.1 glycerophosphodiester phosphodiesterase family protein [Daejeonella sp.]